MQLYILLEAAQRKIYINYKGSWIQNLVTSCCLPAAIDLRPEHSHFYLHALHSFVEVYQYPFLCKTCKYCSLPLTVRETSFSPAPTRGTTARQTYFPASSCLTDFSVRRFSLLRTCGKEVKDHQMQRLQSHLCICDGSKAALTEEKKKNKAAHEPFNTLKVTSSQLLKSNLGSELRRVKLWPLMLTKEKVE